MTAPPAAGHRLAGERRAGVQGRDDAVEHLGFGRIVALETGVPILIVLIVNLV
jgi:hypothetical protein